MSGRKTPPAVVVLAEGVERWPSLSAAAKQRLLVAVATSKRSEKQSAVRLLELAQEDTDRGVQLLAGALREGGGGEPSGLAAEQLAATLRLCRQRLAPLAGAAGGGLAAAGANGSVEWILEHGFTLQGVAAAPYPAAAAAPLPFRLNPAALESLSASHALPAPLHSDPGAGSRAPTPPPPSIAAAAAAAAPPAPPADGVRISLPKASRKVSQLGRPAAGRGGGGMDMASGRSDKYSRARQGARTMQMLDLGEEKQLQRQTAAAVAPKRKEAARRKREPVPDPVARRQP